MTVCACWKQPCVKNAEAAISSQGEGEEKFEDAVGGEGGGSEKISDWGGYFCLGGQYPTTCHDRVIVWSEKS